MERNKLGDTNLIVSSLCFGTLTMGPLQSNQSPKAGAKLLLHAFEKGVNFIDTAELYETYSHINEALKAWSRDKVVIATKSYAYSKKTAEESLVKALKELNTSYIDIFLLHEQESEHTIKGHGEALEYFHAMKEKGYIKAIGISTHTVTAIKAALKIKEIEVLHPIVNKEGLGIQDGTIGEMVQLLKKAHKQGKGIYGMKPLGGGNLLKDYRACFDFVLGLSCLDSIAVGMQKIEEVDVNINIFEGKEIEKELVTKISSFDRRLKIDAWCEVCGKCVAACSHDALKISKDKLIVNQDKCVLCGYCSKYCPHFYIKVI